MREAVINKKRFVEVECDGLDWRIVEFEDNSLQYFLKVGLKYKRKKDPPESVQHLWQLIVTQARGPEQ